MVLLDVLKMKMKTPFDDYPGKHGTIVTHMVTSNLETKNVPFQILPVKIANSNGQIKYFDALCGFQYAVKKENIGIVNMSFGWYSEESVLLEKFIFDVRDRVLVVTSAGNNQTNNDTLPHFPSSYTGANILTIAGLEGTSLNYNTSPGLASFSNFGSSSVDLAAISENIPFKYNGIIHHVNGTSYSSAYATALGAYWQPIAITPVSIKDKIIFNSTFSNNLNGVKYSKYIP